MKWEKKRLGEVFDIARGGSPRPIDKYITTKSDGLNWIMIGDASEGSKYITATKKKISPMGLSKTRQVKAGDFLLTNSMSFGRPYILKTSGCIHDGWLVLSPRSQNVSQDYFYYLLGSEPLKRQFAQGASGAVVKNLNTTMVKNVEIDLPPLPQQKRIAAILDAADALRAKRRESIEQLDSLIQATFLEMCGLRDRPPISIGPPTFGTADKFVPLGDVARLATGHTPDRSIPEYWDGDTPWISLTDIRGLDGAVAESTLQSITDAGLANSSAVRLPAGTVCFSRTASIGFVTVMGCEMATSQDFVNWVCGPLISPIYLMMALRFSRPYLLEKSTGSTHKTIYYRNAEQFHVYLPPIDEQNRFASIVESIEQQKARLKAHLTELDTLFASLQSRAFNGELVA
jgi:type I restriction enzyme S subunit